MRSILTAIYCFSASITNAGTIISCSSLSAIDGDSIRCDGVDMRLLGNGTPYKTGVDAPEIGRAKCDAERTIAKEAKERLAGLLQTRGLEIDDSGAKDHFQRPLVRLHLKDGREAGQVLLDEGYAVIWTPGHKRAGDPWCQR
jgi:micrococcal nuclease